MLLTSKVGNLDQSTHTSVSNGRFNMKRIQFNPGESEKNPTCRHGIFHGLSMTFPKIFRPFYVTMVSKFQKRLEGGHRRQPNATWEGKNFSIKKKPKKKGDQKARNLTILHYILVYFSRILYELLSFWWSRYFMMRDFLGYIGDDDDDDDGDDDDDDDGGKRIMFIMPIIHQHSPEKSLELSVDPIWRSRLPTSEKSTHHGCWDYLISFIYLMS